MSGPGLERPRGRKENRAEGSATLVRSVLRAGLLDELHLLVCPVVLGAGKRLFDLTDGRIPLTLTDSETFPTGVVHLTYQPA